MRVRRATSVSADSGVATSRFTSTDVAYGWKNDDLRRSASAHASANMPAGAFDGSLKMHSAWMPRPLVADDIASNACVCVSSFMQVCVCVCVWKIVL